LLALWENIQQKENVEKGLCFTWGTRIGQGRVNANPTPIPLSLNLLLPPPLPPNAPSILPSQQFLFLSPLQITKYLPSNLSTACYLQDWICVRSIKISREDNFWTCKRSFSPSVSLEEGPPLTVPWPWTPFKSHGHWSPHEHGRNYRGWQEQGPARLFFSSDFSSIN